MKRKFLFILITIAIPLILGGFLLSFKLKSELLFTYKNNQSIFIKDRNHKNIFIKPNHLGYYASYSNEIPIEFKKLLTKKEDKYFYHHFGINPISSLRASYNLATGNDNLASSTITQQLSKILLQNELDRNFKNKFIETIYAISLEIHLSKEEILKMYINSVYFGNKVQGIDNASRLYFESTPALLNKEQNLRLLATLASPSVSNPFLINNDISSKLLCERLNENCQEIKPYTKTEIAERKEMFSSYTKSDISFELNSLKIDPKKSCVLTIDKELSENLREILRRNLLAMSEKDATNGSIVVIKLPENEVLSIIGSPDPEIASYGYQINMAKETRPIGSTVKPFIYLKGFEKGLRPYTTIEDKEYKYTIGTGFAFYPKNYDYEYRGKVSLHYSLTNSLNVPTVKVLEYVGLDNFYNFLLEDIEFSPVQEIENYQLGIALGGLEMDLLSLSYYFTIFPKEGTLTPLNIYQDDRSQFVSTTNFSQNKKVADEKYIQLINKILSDRGTGIEQFGMNSNLNLFQNNYAVKTGTSRDFCDSWTIGYTPDFLVGVWVGNSDNTPMDKISGQSGAGRIWNETMNLLINSEYNKKTPFEFDLISEFYENENIEYGLFEDDYEEKKNLLQNDSLILNPHNGDTFLLEENTQIPLRAKKEVWWYVNGKFLGEEKEIVFDIENSGVFKIKALGEEGEEEIVEIFVEEE